MDNLNEFLNTLDRSIDEYPDLAPEYYGSQAENHPYQIWRVHYDLPDGKTLSGYTTDRQLVDAIDHFGWLCDPISDTYGWEDEEKFKKWKAWSVIKLPPAVQSVEAKKSQMHTWWVNHKNKAKSSFMDKEGKDPRSTTQLGLYAAFVLESVKRISQGVKTGELLTSEQAEALKKELTQSLVALAAPGGPPLTVEDINNLKPSVELQGKWEAMKKRKRDASSDT